MSEKAYSKTIKKHLRADGFFILDLESLGNGIPDSLLIKKTHPNKCCFLEFKTKDGSFTPAQFAFLATEKYIDTIIVQEPMGYEELSKKIKELFK